jgi:predicted transcriptional regulator
VSAAARPPRLRLIGGAAPDRQSPASARALMIEVKAFDEPVVGLRESLKAIRSAAPATRGEVRVLSAEQLRAVLAWERLTLLRAIHKTRPRSVNELARTVNRTPPAVNEDLRLLAQYGLVQLATTRGRAKAPEVPYREIQVRIEM